MRGRLGDVEAGRVYVDCAACKRSGRYSTTSLIERYGRDISQVDLLRHLSASCPYQRRAGAPPARKYEPLCLAAITMPPARQVGPPVPPGRPFTIEIWSETGGKIEMQLATIYPLDMAIAAFELACQQWPAREITLRDRCRIVRKQERIPLADRP